MNAPSESLSWGNEVSRGALQFKRKKMGPDGSRFRPAPGLINLN
jgi:hypothetical protein